MGLLAMICVAAAAQSPGPLLLEAPTVSRSHIVFAYAGDIWVVDRTGGDARRLTTNPAHETRPTLSPDGSQVAYARFNPAGGPFSSDVYVLPVAGGEPRRLTYHPDLDFPINWTPDGNNVLFLSFRQRTSTLGGRLYTVAASGGFPTEVPVPRGWAGSFSGDGKRIAYTPLINPIETVGWRKYRGGGTSKIWLVGLPNGGTEAIPHGNFNDLYPMWVEDRVYFVSDRTGTENLFVYDTTKKTIAQLTRFEKYGVKSAAANGDTIVFNQDGAIHLLDLKTNQTTRVNIRVPGDFPGVKPRKIDAAQWLNSVGVSPDASSLLFGIRGEVFTAKALTGEVENITRTGSAAERNPVWSPDGKWIAYFSDESGEQQLFLRAAQPGDPETRRISIESKPSFYSELQWSPDSKKLVFSNAHLKLLYFDLEQNVVRPVDTARFTDGDTSFQPTWSPDSRWLAYSKFGVNRLRSITLYSFDTGKNYPVTPASFDAQTPLFDLSGKYIYFIGSNRTALVESQGMSGFPFRTQVTRNLYAVVLNRNDSSPLHQPAEQQTGITTTDRTAIDVENIADRIVVMPFWPSNANRIMPGRPGVLFIVEGVVLHKFAIGKAGLEKFAEGAGNYRITSDGSRLALRRQGIWSIVSTDTPPKPEDGRLKLNSIELEIDPRSEWKQMYGDAWRRMREYFYDPNLHGLNLAELQAHYAAYLPNIATREDLSLLFREMFSHLSVSHLGIDGGDISVPQGGVEESVGLLGADFKIESGRYRIKRILRGDGMRLIVSPLTQPGVNISVGEYVLAVDGEEIKAEENFYRYFLNKAFKAVQLKVGPNADGQWARVIRVIPISSEVQLRQNDWVISNRALVTERSGGKLGYIYLPDTSDAGYNAFNSEFYAQLDKQGLIVDGRFNQGGRAADYIIDTLLRIPLQRAQLRDAEDVRIPGGIIEGPKVLLTNEMAGSGGDTLPWMWQQKRVGLVVGTRTAGAGIGATTHPLLDGGSMRVPDWAWYNPDTGTWLMENRGVTPDIVVEILPADWRAGRDLQLEKAIQLAVDALKKMKVAPTRRPTFPVYQ